MCAACMYGSSATFVLTRGQGGRGAATASRLTTMRSGESVLTRPHPQLPPHGRIYFDQYGQRRLLRLTLRCCYLDCVKSAHNGRKLAALLGPGGCTAAPWPQTSTAHPPPLRQQHHCPSRRHQGHFRSTGPSPCRCRCRDTCTTTSTVARDTPGADEGVEAVRRHDDT